MDHRVVAGLLTMMALTLPAASASAGPCTAEIAEIEQSIQKMPDEVGSAPESREALLRHQPTPASVEIAKHTAKAGVMMVLSEAKALDAQGKAEECRDAVAKARVLINP
ncbi:MAG TPA: hypothetical protein VII20_23555 [Roseiarcus sp.]|jgi:hypothetical protein